MIPEFSNPLPGELTVETPSTVKPQRSTDSNSGSNSQEFTEALKLTQQGVANEPAIDSEQSNPSAVIETNLNEHAAEPVSKSAQQAQVEPAFVHAPKSIVPRPTSFPVLKIKLTEPAIEEVLFQPVEYFDAQLSPPDSLVPVTESILRVDVAVPEPLLTIHEATVDTANEVAEHTIVPEGQTGAELLDLEGVEPTQNSLSRTETAELVSNREEPDLRIAPYAPLSSLVITQPAESTVNDRGAQTRRESRESNQQQVDAGASDVSISSAELSDSNEHQSVRISPSELHSDSLAQIPRPLPSLTAQPETSDKSETFSPDSIQELAKARASEPNAAEQATARQDSAATVIEQKNVAHGTENGAALLSDVVAVENSPTATAESIVVESAARSAAIDVHTLDDGIQTPESNGASIGGTQSSVETLFSHEEVSRLPSSQADDGAFKNTDGNSLVRRLASTTNDTSGESDVDVVSESVLPVIVHKSVAQNGVEDIAAENTRVAVKTDVPDLDEAGHRVPTHRNHNVVSEPVPAVNDRRAHAEFVVSRAIESTDQSVQPTVVANEEASTSTEAEVFRKNSGEQVHVERAESTAGVSHAVNVETDRGDGPEASAKVQDAVRPALVDSDSVLADSKIEEQDGKLSGLHDSRENASRPRTDISSELPKSQPPSITQGQPAGRQAASGDLHRSAVVPVEVQEAASAIRRAVSGDGHVRIQLNPPELGVMQVEVVRSEGTTIARLETHNAAAHQAIIDTLGNLQKALAQTGSGVERVEVILNESRSESIRHSRDRQDGEQSSERQRDRGDNPSDRGRDGEQKRRRQQQDSREDDVEQRAA